MYIMLILYRSREQPILTLFRKCTNNQVGSRSRFPVSLILLSLNLLFSLLYGFTHATNAAIPSLASQMARASPLILHSVHQMNHFNNCSVPTIQKRNLGILDIVIQTTIGMIKVCFCCRCNCTNHWTCWTSQNDRF